MESSTAGVGVGAVSGGAGTVPPVSDSQKQQSTTDSAQAGSPNSQTAGDDDPEIDFGDLKIKRSEAAKALKARKELDRGAHQRFQEAAELRRQAAADRQAAEETVKGLSKDAKAALRKAGIDPVRFAEEVLSETLADAELSPEARRVRELEAEKQARDAQDEADKTKQQQDHEVAQVALWESRFNQAFVETITKHGLPKDEDTIWRMANKVESYWGSEVPVTLDEIAEEVREEQERAFTPRLQSLKDDQLFPAVMTRFESMTGEAIVAALPVSVRDKIRKAFLAQAPPANKPKRPNQPDVLAPPKGPLTREQLEARVQERLRKLG